MRTPNFDRLAAKGTLMTETHLGSFPCLPARRDFWTGRFEFPWRGWGPLEDDDLDLFQLLRSNGILTAMVSDHYHVLERDAGNYHFGFQQWDMIRGQEHDPYLADPDVQVPVDHLNSPVYLTHRQNSRGSRRSEEELYSAQVFRSAAQWLEMNGTKKRRVEQPFCLMIECFDPHEPWDPPEYEIDRFDPGFEGVRPQSPSYGSADRFTPEQLMQMRAIYAAELSVVDRWFGRLLDKLDQLELWEDTMVIATTDHGFFLGEHGLVGKPDRTPLYSEMSRIPFIAYHPKGKPGGRRSELVQLVDVFPTLLDAFGISMPPEQQVKESSRAVVGNAGRKAWQGIADHTLQLHGRSLLPLLAEGENAGIERRIACSSKFGDIVRITDGEWALYLPPARPDAELNWHGVRVPGRLFGAKRGPFVPEAGLYPVVEVPPVTATAKLFYLSEDPEELRDVYAERPEQAEQLKLAFAGWLQEVGAPEEVAVRYGVAP